MNLPFLVSVYECQELKEEGRHHAWSCHIERSRTANSIWPGQDVPVSVSVSAVRGAWEALMGVGRQRVRDRGGGERNGPVARVSDFLEIQVERRSSDDADTADGETIDVQLPITVVDGLLSGDSDKLNVSAAIERLGTLRGDIVRVTETDRQVRVWIDEVGGG